MLLLTPWVARLREAAGDLRKVGAAADLSAIKGGHVPTPSAWVIPVSESAQDNETVGVVSQRVSSTVGIVMVVRNLRDTRGDEAQDDLAVIRQQIRDALLGWSPGNEYDPATFSRGRLISLDDQVLWWQDEFQTAYYMRSA
jgi:hypothetical protein